MQHNNPQTKEPLINQAGYYGDGKTHQSEEAHKPTKEHEQEQDHKHPHLEAIKQFAGLGHSHDPESGHQDGKTGPE
ncbi:hypothetical protein K7432_004945 [Basidiobolus ranarum]|uniref:Dehydrin n=1 Tax=Basidiobolus ranarum TaxID=34480 RepID=A0ABR2W3V3_9FUNG